MISHIPHSSRVFIGLLIISLLLSYIAITLSHYQERLAFDYGSARAIGTQSEPITTVDTTDWVAYNDTAYPIAFSYPANWKVTTKITAEKFYSINIAIPNVTPSITIYISDTEYFGLDGLELKQYTLPNLSGISVNESLIGVKKGEYYYTFDGSMNTEQFTEFSTLMKTVVLE